MSQIVGWNNFLIFLKNIKSKQYYYFFKKWIKLSGSPTVTFLDITFYSHEYNLNGSALKTIKIIIIILLLF